ncbi:MAG: anaerobic ribonucleoside-triphosphate reductase activating protein [Clostridiales bacterium]|nr:anaerobic ribonucleoside-triphosphate reductase activating protein [Clostridiales bacterium]
MQIHGLNKTTLLDYPGHVAATLFTGTCNFRCPFCHNGDLVICPESQPALSEDEIFAFLNKRKNILTGVCISGGEPTLQPDLTEFIQKIRELGYLVKLDTNGYRPDVLRKLADNRLVDYVAMDIKSGRDGYAQTCGISSFDFSRIEESAHFLMQCGIPYEFRTTVVHELHSDFDFLQIAELIGGCSAYFLQSYVDSGQVLRPGFHACTREEMLHFQTLLTPYIPNTLLRGID